MALATISVSKSSICSGPRPWALRRRGRSNTVRYSCNMYQYRGLTTIVNYRRIQAEFLARGEGAWQEYQRTGQSRPAAEVFDRIQGRIDARRQALVHQS